MNVLLELFVCVCKVTREMSAFCKDKVADSCPKADGQKQPAIERHDDEHEYVAISDLNDV